MAHRFAQTVKYALNDIYQVVDCRSDTGSVWPESGFAIILRESR